MNGAFLVYKNPPREEVDKSQDLTLCRGAQLEFKDSAVCLSKIYLTLTLTIYLHHLTVLLDIIISLFSSDNNI